MPTAEVVHGDVVVLRPGDRVPVDGEIVAGETSVDESLVTGESVPVAKKAGDKVVGGSVNGAGSARFRATGVGEETTLARIGKLVQTAQNSKAPGQRIADRAAAYLVVLAVAVGIVTFVAWKFGAGASFTVALTFAISALVIACPDALGLATPTAVAVGTGLGARRNILIKDAATLEGASRITAVALDKTGTLTEGKPRVTEVLTAAGTSREEALALLAAVEQSSSHPLAAAVLDEARRAGVAFAKPERFENVAGHGLKATVGGRSVLVGNVRLMKSQGADLAPLQEAIDRLLAAGRTMILLAVDGSAAAALGVADPVEPSARRAVAEMKRLGIQTAMISGDNQAVADAVAAEVGIDRRGAAGAEGQLRPATPGRGEVRGDGRRRRERRAGARAGGRRDRDRRRYGRGHRGGENRPDEVGPARRGERDHPVEGLRAEDEAEPRVGQRLQPAGDPRRRRPVLPVARLVAAAGSVRRAHVRFFDRRRR